MDFFARQENARRHTFKLVLLFLAAVIAIIGAADLVVTIGVAVIFDGYRIPVLAHEILVGVIALGVVVFAARRLINLRGGGESIAKMVNARLVARSATGLDERRLLNVVDEMSIASGVAVPSVWVMDNEEGINAFAAGYSPNHAVIVVTKGTLTKLNREELQGVIGHEFSHILNGDMRLNVRLIGILAGIVIVGEAGLVVIKLGAEAGDTGAIPFIIWGAIMAGVGYIGVMFGRAIKAAVARQREFLADASSVQFTRNPDGLLAALEKIRKDGTRVGNAYAGEMSHMFFASAIQPKVFAQWFATHPSVDERVAAITGRALPAGAQRAEESAQPADGVVESLLAQVGTASPQHVVQAAKLLVSMPDALRTLLQSPDGARAVVYAYLLATDARVRAVQARAIGAAGDGGLMPRIEETAAAVRGLGAAARLPVLTLAIPALRQMEAAQRTSFLAAADALIDADNEVTLDEFTLRTILRQQLASKPADAGRVRYRDLAALADDAALLIATVAQAGSPDPAAQKTAYARGAARAKLPGTMPASSFSAAAVTAALERLRQLAPLAKPDVIAACVETALADRKLVTAEVELLRAVAMTLDCPLPPAIETQAPGAA